MISQPRRRARLPAGRDAPSLADVARAAGVSTASASRALARPELVSETVLARVSAAASRMGYVANAAARALSTRKSGVIGAVLADAADPVLLPILEAAERVFSAQGIGVLLRVASSAVSALVCARSLAARGVDGLLLVGDGAVPDMLSATSLPYVVCGQNSGPAGAAPAQSLERRGLALACAYLRQLGHERVGVIAGRREEGVGQLAPAPEHVRIEKRVGPLYDTDAVRSAARLMMRGEVTAIVATSDVAAAAVLRECRALQLAVPRQVSVIGWGDSELARCLDPALTSVRLPTRVSGQAAAEYLIATMAGDVFAWPDLPLKLVIRDSTGPAPP